MKPKRVFAGLLIAILAIVVVTILVNSRAKANHKKLLYDLPETGYRATNPYVETYSRISVKVKDGVPTHLVIEIKMLHKSGAGAINRAVISAKMDDDIASILWSRRPYVIFDPEQYIDLGEGWHPGLVFSREAPIDEEAGMGTVESLLSILDRPIRIKISHSQGVELIETVPEIIIGDAEEAF